MKIKHIATRDLTLEIAKRIAETAGKTAADTKILCRDKGANAKSLMGVIALSYRKGETLWLIAEGRDADRVIETLKTIL